MTTPHEDDGPVTEPMPAEAMERLRVASEPPPRDAAVHERDTLPPPSLAST